MRKLYLIAFVFISSVACSQNHKIDSLQKVLKTQKEDTNKVNTLFRISELYRFQRDADQAMEYQKQALLLSEKLKFRLGKAKAIYYIGNIYFFKENYAEALEYYYKSLNLFEELGDRKWIFYAHSRIGGTYYNQDNFTDALESDQLCLQLAQEMEDSALIAQMYNEVGDSYYKLGNFDKAFPLFYSALHFYEMLGSRAPSSGLPWSYGYIGTIYEYYGDTLIAVGDKISATREYIKGLSFYEKKLNINKKNGKKDLSGVSEMSIYIGNLLIKLGKYSESRKYINTGLKIAYEIDFKKLLQFGYETASKLDSATGDYKSWIYNYKMFIAYRDSLYNEESKKKTLQAQMQYDFDKKELAAKAEQERKDALTNAEISKQKVVRNFSIAGAVGILSLGGYVFYNFRKRKKLENQRALADERLRISRDLHDDMGASLSSISVFSSAVKQKLLNNETQEAEQLLDRMSNDAQEMVSGMSEMVWTINPHNDTIEKLTDRLQVYAAGMLSAKNISFNLECDEELKNKKLPVEMRKNIFLILKEAINNAAKYSCATEVKLTVSKKENRMVAVLADNGKGFDISSRVTGNGLNNMRQRADEIQAQIEIISEINKGTSVNFLCLLPKIGEA